MYSITSRDRRVTDYVKEQAYVWLYNKISNGEYYSHGHEAEGIVLRIKEAHKVTEKSYDEFRSYFGNDPYFYMLNYKGKKISKGITTPYMENYFIKFNDVILPVGFIKDFFEDDYETVTEVNEYMLSFSEGSLDEFVISCQKIKNKRDAEIEKIRKNTPYLFNSNVLFHVTNIIKIVLVFFALALCIRFFATNELINNFAELVRTGQNQFIEDNIRTVITCVIMFLFVLIKLKKVIVLLLFYISFLRITFFVKSLQYSLDNFNNTTIETIKEYFKGIISNFKNTNFFITDDMCSVVPRGKHQYLSIINFNSSKIESNIQKISSNKRYKNIHFYYDSNTTISSQKRFWKKGIMSTVIIILILMFSSISELREALINFLASTPLSEFFDFHKS